MFFFAIRNAVVFLVPLGEVILAKKSQTNVRQILPSNQESPKKCVKSTFSIVGSGGEIRVGDLPGGMLSSKF